MKLNYLFKSRLIWKIMLIFWLTTICTILANIYITKEIMLNERKVDDLRNKMRLLAYEAVNIVEHKGEKGIRKWYRKLHRKNGIRVVLLDQNGAAIGAPGKLGYDEEAALSGNFDHPPDRPESRFLRAVDQSIMSSTGKHYTLRALPSRYLKRTFGSPESMHGLRAFVTMIIIFAGSLWLAISVAKPVNALRRASSQIAMGNFDVHVVKEVGPRKDELGQLSEAFDVMAKKVEGLLEDQRQLFRDISHEIRTPLTRQKLAIELARGADNPDAMLDKLEAQNSLIEELIDNLLNMLKLDNGKVNLKYEELNVANLVDNLVSAAELDIHTKHLTIDVTIADDMTIMADRNLITRALENILVNAIKYSPENGTISISAHNSNTESHLQIEDEGSGIPDHDLKRVKEPFYRADKSRAKITGGFGLGLAIVDRIIVQHKGTLKLENTSPKGLKVSIALPQY